MEGEALGGLGADAGELLEFFDEAGHGLGVAGHGSRVQGGGWRVEGAGYRVEGVGYREDFH